MKKKILLLATSTFVSISVISLVLISNQESHSLKANEEHYKLVMNSSKNKLHNNTGSTAYSGETTVKTNLDNDITISYTDLMGMASTWHVAKTGGSFYNTTPIHGLESISLTFKTDAKDFKLYWSSSTSFNEDDSQTFTSSTSSLTTFNFNDYYPTYFKFVNTSGSNLNVSGVELSFSCQNNYPTLFISSENETMGTVSGPSGVVRSGQNVSIVATPTKDYYRFVGWYKGDELISSSATYNFVMGYENLTYVARFTYQSYYFVVQSESNTKGSVVNVSGYYDFLTPITIEATANDGYTFLGWYKGNTLVSRSNPYTFNMPSQYTEYTAKFSTNSYDLTLINANPDLGNISSSNSYLYGSSVTVVATPNTGISFLGWYDMDDNLISPLSSYTFDMPHEDLIYVAKFEWTPYTVQLTINDSTMGSVTGGGSYVYQQNVTLVATPNEHYSFFGWYDGETLVSQESTYNFKMPANSLNYTARFVQNHNLYIYSDDESKGTVSFPSEWGEGLEVTITANPETGYVLDYWYDDDLNEVSYDASYTFVMPNHDVSLYASFVIGYTLTVTSSDVTKGTVSGGGLYIAGSNVTVTMNYISDIFTGWFDEDDQLVSMDNPYTFVMPSNNYSLEARFITQAEKYGITPVLSQDGTTITYGLYPQTHVSDPSLITALDSLTTPEPNGWYLYNDDYYTKVSATTYDSYSEFDDGTKIENNTTYWFRCELITWNILNNDSGNYFIISSVLLDAHCYYNLIDERTIDGETVQPNNYKYSDIRTWLNEDFYNSAFALGNDYILTTTVDNSASTTYSPNNNYACENTQDKVFLPSYQDYLNSDFGFSTSADAPYGRYCKTTDWARARGAYDEGFIPLRYNGAYWTRSPGTGSCYASYVDTWGYVTDDRVDYASVCVRPAITLSFN